MSITISAIFNMREQTSSHAEFEQQTINHPGYFQTENKRTPTAFLASQSPQQKRVSTPPNRMLNPSKARRTNHVPSINDSSTTRLLYKSPRTSSKAPPTPSIYSFHSFPAPPTSSVQGGQAHSPTKNALSPRGTFNYHNLTI